jgi:hypothetical protein
LLTFRTRRDKQVVSDQFRVPFIISQQTIRVFAASSKLERKRKAEQSLVDQITALRRIVLQLIKGHKAQREQADTERVSQRQEVEELKVVIQTLRQETERQSRATSVLEALSERSARTTTYS